jgi:hypothetical protein
VVVAIEAALVGNEAVAVGVGAVAVQTGLVAFELVAGLVAVELVAVRIDFVVVEQRPCLRIVEGLGRWNRQSSRCGLRSSPGNI